jgi:ribosomal protein L24E
MEGRPYKEPYFIIDEHLQGIKRLAEYVEAGDREGFSLVLNGNRLLDRANIAIDISQPESPLIVEAPSLLRFMVVEMWNEFGGERPAKLGFRTCSHCGRQFQIGGRRGTKTLRTDARFCSNSCRNMASRARVKLQRNAVLTPRR